MTGTIFKGHLILGYFQRLNCQNFCLILTQAAKLDFLKSALNCLNRPKMISV